ncbi:ATP-binding protein [Sphingomonas sp. CROZ-RG-20F-R02-07]|uniref:sensor histidine kinase n=1 Tax=Sphingomonas sp. CROZ-RG-20F-R02-07 TaxID=2914832 RepID=UPI001F563E4E|nr:ATP-binding protein [Sphingomonas sp. CROZ-RG-20F-R02-07]
MDLPALPLPTTGQRVERLLAICVGLGFVALIVAAAVAVHALDRSQARNRSVVHSYQVEVAIGEARQLIEQSEDARRGIFLLGSPLAWRSWREATVGTPIAMRRLNALVLDRGQREAIGRIDGALVRLGEQHRATNALAARGDLEGATALFKRQDSPGLFRPLRGYFIAMAQEERRILAQRTADQRAALLVFYWTLAIVGLVIAVLLLVSVATIVRYTRDLAQSRESLRALNDTLEDQVSARTADLSRANDEIQRFAYIVSHDLRSPLVNVMGFTAELEAATAPLATLVDRAEAEAPAIVTEDARLAAREDLPEAIRFIRTSTQKMDRLINAILKLSREGRRTIAPEPLDLEAMADNVVGAIRHVLDDRRVEVIVQRPMPPLTSDRIAVEQIVSNLVENASKYQAAGRPARITVSAHAQGGRVTIAVADNGRGIAAGDHERIFDLFRRSGPQDQQGEGIGLAHVRAAAYRLGGTVQVESTLGQGSTFRLVLPQTPPAHASGDSA